MKIFLGSDHAGPALKKALEAKLRDLHSGYTLNDLGPDSEDPVDYPDYAEKVCREVVKNPGSFGILICGSGIGMSISANKIKGIRAALCHSVEYAKLARQHNHANVLCLGARFLTLEAAIEIVEMFLKTEPSREPRHQNRVDKSDRLG